MVVPLEREASNSSQSQSSISDSEYSFVSRLPIRPNPSRQFPFLSTPLFPAELSWLDSCVISSGSCLFLGRWSGVNIVSTEAVVSAVDKGSGA